MKYNDELLTQITQAGTLGYPLSKILNVFDIQDEDQFKKDFYDETTKINKAYQKGVDKSEFLLDSKLFEMAKDGDIKAMDKLEFRKKQRSK